MTLYRNCALAALATAALAGCGEDDEQAATPTTAPPAATTAAPATTATTPAKPTGTPIKLAGSDYGRILYDGRGQAIYLFTKDGRDRTRCFGACAEAWPPVYTKGEPRAVAGVRQSL